MASQRILSFLNFFWWKYYQQPLKLLYFDCIPHMSFIWAVNKIRLQYNLTFTLNINTRPDLDCQHIWMAIGGNICTILLLLLMLHAGEGRELQYLSSFNFGDLSFSSDEAIIEDYVTLANAPQARHLCLKEMESLILIFCHFLRSLTGALIVILHSEHCQTWLTCLGQAELPSSFTICSSLHNYFVHTPMHVIQVHSNR